MTAIYNALFGPSYEVHHKTGDTTFNKLAVGAKTEVANGKVSAANHAKLVEDIRKIVNNEDDFIGKVVKVKIGDEEYEMKLEKAPSNLTVANAKATGYNVLTSPRTYVAVAAVSTIYARLYHADTFYNNAQWAFDNAFNTTFRY